ncbi:MAG: energy-coupling factor transporter transmembrane protein EcfT [Defluviitaleaceae bacterium]|nr:energy-coupling factor transporter transmembrane protein EcfT [Defluviitaleaceae bacterium]
MTKITIGQHYPTDSIIHHLDARVKLIGTIMYIVFLLFVNHYAGYGVAALFLTGIIALSKIPPRLIFRGLRMIVFILIFAAGINLFFTAGETVLFHFAFIRITLEGIMMASHMAMRLILLVMGSSILTLTTSPIQLTDGIESLLNPLKPIKVPAHDIAMLMTIALRYIPALAEEMEKIMKAQKARGADFDTGGLIKRIRSMLPILVPLFVSAFKRADELATAMEARCYRGDINRTKMKAMKMTRTEFIGMGVMICFGGLIFLTRLL